MAPFQPLDGLRVVDLTHAFAGPLCTLQLGLYGAEVVKIERPGHGDHFRSRGDTFGALNAGKLSVALDLKSDQGRDAVLDMIKNADILVENLRPGSLAALGLDWGSVSSLNPDLIYCSISGFGQQGEWAQVPAIEWSGQAMTGLADSYLPEDADPMFLGVGMLDPFAGYLAFTAILAALLERGRSGGGVRVDAAMIDASMLLMASRIPHKLRDDDGATNGNPALARRRATMARFATADGEMFIGALHQRWFEALCREIDAEDLLEDERFANETSRHANTDATWEALQERIRPLAARDLEPRLQKLGLPAARVRKLKEVAEQPHVIERGSLQPVTVTETGDEISIGGAGVRFNDSTLQHRGPVPMLGQHTHQVLQGLGYSDTEIAALTGSGESHA